MNEDQALNWQKTNSNQVIKNEWIDFREDYYHLPDGRDFGPFYNYSCKNYVVIVATDQDGNYICVRQYRHGTEEVTNEFPAGAIENNGSLAYRGKDALRDAKVIQKLRKNDANAPIPEHLIITEDPLDAAKRELLEETGYTSEDWSKVIVEASNATMSDNYAFIYRAKMCKRSGTQDLDDTEFVNVAHYSEEQLLTLIREGQFQQAVHVMAYFASKYL